jgi:hypothetical protein
MLDVEALTNGLLASCCDMLSDCCVSCFCPHGDRPGLNVRIFKVCFLCRKSMSLLFRTFYTDFGRQLY